MTVAVECQHCHREIAQAQLGNHMRAMHQDILKKQGNGAASVTIASPRDDDGIQWEEPPIPARAGREAALAPIVAKLRGHPNRWARVRTYSGPTSASTQVTKARKAFSDCEWRAAKIDGGSALWARFVGPENEAL